MMCGIAGFFDFSGGALDHSANHIGRTMALAIRHRGPDDAGVWSDAERGIVLSHRRLSIMDLSSAGHQPMLSGSGRYVIAFNGEIYNHLDLRHALEHGQQIQWRGHSDTETLLAAMDQWGIDKTVTRSVGMFAFAVWDRHEQSLTLCRDRLGEKPLYYGWQGNIFLFGSELKALRAHPSWRGEINRDAITLLLRYMYIPAPYSIYTGINKLTPGCLLKLDLNRKLSNTPYWSAREVFERGATNRFAGSPEDAVTALDSLLKETLRTQMIADVPLGAFLSGGIDSSTIVALMQAQSYRPVRTFTIGFHEQEYDEASHARAIAHHLGTQHTELYVTPRETRDMIPRLPTLYDEPFADCSQIPTLLLAQLAREHVTVCLSGDGGDELFGGYTRYALTHKLWQRLHWIPAPVRHISSRLLSRALTAIQNVQNQGLLDLTAARVHQLSLTRKLHKLALMLQIPSAELFYNTVVSHWQYPAMLVNGATEPATAITDMNRWATLPDFIQRLMYLDLISYLPDDILVKVDRAAMAVGLESRIPLLDFRIVEFAASLPFSHLNHGGETKYPLRRLLYRHVPKYLVDRPKMGFGIPIDTWLRGPLREWGETLLDKRRLQHEGFLNPLPILTAWHDHVTGRRNCEYMLWDVLMFQAWLEQEKSGPRLH